MATAGPSGTSGTGSIYNGGVYHQLLNDLKTSGEKRYPNYKFEFDNYYRMPKPIDDGFREDIYLNMWSKANYYYEVLSKGDFDPNDMLENDNPEPYLTYPNVHIHFYREAKTKSQLKKTKYYYTYTGRCPKCEYMTRFNTLTNLPSNKRRSYKPEAHRFCHQSGYADLARPRIFSGDSSEYNAIINTLKGLYDNCNQNCKFNIYAQNKNVDKHTSFKDKLYTSNVMTSEQLKAQEKEINDIFEDSNVDVTDENIRNFIQDKINEQEEKIKLAKELHTKKDAGSDMETSSEQRQTPKKMSKKERAEFNKMRKQQRVAAGTKETHGKGMMGGLYKLKNRKTKRKTKKKTKRKTKKRLYNY